MDALFLAVAAIGLGLVSAMIAFRLGASGAGRRRVVFALGELWVVAALWVAFFRWLSAAVGTPAPAGGFGEMRELPARFAHLSSGAKVAAAIGLVACLALVAHLMRSLGRLTEGPIGA